MLLLKFFQVDIKMKKAELKNKIHQIYKSDFPEEEKMKKYKNVLEFDDIFLCENCNFPVGRNIFGAKYPLSNIVKVENYLKIHKAFCPICNKLIAEISN